MEPCSYGVDNLRCDTCRRPLGLLDLLDHRYWGNLRSVDPDDPKGDIGWGRCYGCDGEMRYLDEVYLLRADHLSAIARRIYRPHGDLIEQAPFCFACYSRFTRNPNDAAMLEERQRLRRPPIG